MKLECEELSGCFAIIIIHTWRRHATEISGPCFLQPWKIFDCRIIAGKPTTGMLPAHIPTLVAILSWDHIFGRLSPSDPTDPLVKILHMPITLGFGPVSSYYIPITQFLCIVYVTCKHHVQLYIRTMANLQWGILSTSQPVTHTPIGCWT